MSLSSFMEKITNVLRKKKPPPSVVWGHCMEMTELTVDQKKWLHLYIRLGCGRRSTKFFARATSEVAMFFSKEQLAEQEDYRRNYIKTNGSRSGWETLVKQQLRINNILL